MERYTPPQTEYILPTEVQEIAGVFENTVKHELVHYAELYIKTLQPNYSLDEEIAFAKAFDKIETLSHHNPAIKNAVEKIEMLIMDKQPKKEIAA